MLCVVGDVDIIEVEESQIEEKIVYEFDYVIKIVCVCFIVNIQYYLYYGMLMDVIDYVINFEGIVVFVCYRGLMVVILQ